LYWAAKIPRKLRQREYRVVIIICQYDIKRRRHLAVTLAAKGIHATGHFAICDQLDRIPHFVEELNADLISGDRNQRLNEFRDHRSRVRPR